MTAKNKALSLLARQSYTSRRLADKLLEKGFEQQETDDAIEWCTGQGYLNDAGWAARKAEQKSAKGWSQYKIASYLRHYGIQREDISGALEALEEGRMPDTDEYE
jgi:regulatory protein